MPYLEIGGRRHSIPAEETAIGLGPDGEIALGGGEQSSTAAILASQADGQVVIRKADSDIALLINGVPLGPQPNPLLHGDKIEIGGQELLFVDDQQGGSTHFVKAIDPALLKSAMKPGAKKGKATSGTGGRLVSLTDGREYSIERGSLLIGREASCDVVAESKKVSRRHAEIVATPKGYLLIDNSTNGTLVNGERVAGQRLLARADVIRCGDDEFRFYADVLQVPESEPAAPVAAPPVADVPAPVTPVADVPAPVTPVADVPAAVTPVAEVPTPARPTAKETTPVPEPPQPQPLQPAPKASPVGNQPAGSGNPLRDTMFGIRIPPKMSTPEATPASPEKKPAATAPRAPLFRPPPGAEYRLSDTLDGIPRRPPQAGTRGSAGKPAAPSDRAPTAPPGAQHRLSDTLHGVRPEIEAGAFGGESKPSKLSQTPPGADPRPSDMIHGIPGVPKDGADEIKRGIFPRTGEKEAVDRPRPSADGSASISSRPSKEVPLASFVVRSGSLKGQRLAVRYPVVNIGRAEYNDVVLQDDSISTVHAKLQRREGIWVLVDQESTNGTVVDGERLTGETVLAPGAMVRFGTLQTIFEPTDDLADIHKGKATKVIQSIKLPPPAGS